MGLPGGIAVVFEERPLAGAVSGGFYLVGALTLVTLIALPGHTHGDDAVLLALAAIASVWGLASLLVIDWRTAPPAVMYLSSAATLGIIAAAVASSGGASSPAWIYLFLMAVFVAYFYPPRIALVYLCAAIATQALVLLYDPRSRHDAFIDELVIASACYLAIGASIIAGKRQLASLRMRAERLAAEHGALQRLATTAVAGEPPERIYALLAEEIAGLLGAGSAFILRFDDIAQATVIGSWADREGGLIPAGTVVEIGPGSDVARARAQGAPVRTESHPPGSRVNRLGYTASIAAPVVIGGESWGALVVTAASPMRLTDRDERGLMRFGELLATVIVSNEERARLSAQASTDPLTGLANHGALQERLEAEVSRAVRHDAPLSLALIDVDNFKQVNDFGGHETGDAMLVRVARCLADHARTEDTLGRMGGDEFAWVMPDTSREQALVAVERARSLIAATVSRQYRITVSAGICDTNATNSATELANFADTALYWSKANGRNRSWIYDPGAITELSERERLQRMERGSALMGLRALARAIDAHDPVMTRHSDRIAALVSRLALTAGWPPDRAVLLSEAALVHDVGKVGIRRELLEKSGVLTDAEREQVKDHAELAARIAEGVLTPEQVEWIRDHHERPDGRGYPRGLTAEEIPEGAALLAVADAWDAMTTGRPYKEPVGVEAALAECTRLVGVQFSSAAIDALLKLHASGELDASHGPAPGPSVGCQAH